ncbi:MAG: hypothetical protein A2289_11640 [Deltaproteobacteria bacterium RIFOXYA12_FULL_58_15]|nr:MAG: hypothetical protein A2289_11640 [Deltaproteobacteria bacterium RIFOXYA12_FULL_58_15]
MSQRLNVEMYTRPDTAAFMTSYIREHFADMLGPYAALLDQPGGLDLLADLLRDGQIGPVSNRTV